MFAKLLKYEWKAMAHTMLPLYLVVLAVAVVTGVTTTFPNMMHQNGQFYGGELANIIQTVAIIAYVSVMAALFVVNFVIVIRRFYNGVVGDEGCLVMTIPVHLWEIPLAKCLIGLLYAFFTGVVAVIAVLILAGPGVVREFMGIDWNMLWNSFTLYFPKAALLILETIVMLVLGLAAELYHIYLAIMLGQRSNNHRIAMSLVWYVVINLIVSIVSSVVFAAANAGGGLAWILMASETAAAVETSLLFTIGATVVELTAFSAGTQYLMAKRLNL